MDDRFREKSKEEVKAIIENILNDLCQLAEKEEAQKEAPQIDTGGTEDRGKRDDALPSPPETV